MTQSFLHCDRLLSEFVTDAQTARPVAVPPTIPAVSASFIKKGFHELVHVLHRVLYISISVIIFLIINPWPFVQPKWLTYLNINPTPLFCSQPLYTSKFKV